MSPAGSEASFRQLTVDLPPSLWQALEAAVEASGETVEHLVRVALSERLGIGDHGTLFQVSTAGALVEGLYRGVVTVAELRDHGDFGIGTLAGLDGEMVALDGRFYQARADGAVVEVADSARCPYAVVTRFTPVENERRVIDEATDLAVLHAHLDGLRESANAFYAIRVDGRFDSVLTRSVSPTAEGVPLAEAAAAQTEMEFSDVQGTLVGFWSPGFLGGALVSGYHLHFLSDDRQSAGHLLACSGRSLAALVRRESEFRLSLPESAAFLRADLSRDPSEALRAAESKPEEGKR